MKKIIFVIICLSAKISMAQIAVTNTGTLYLSSSGDIIFAASDFTNNTGAALTNNGQLYVQGNLTNNQSAMPIGTGTLTLNGSLAQALNGTQPFRTMNFVSSNAAGITLNNNLSVSGAHTFTSGLITTSATPNYLVYEAGSSYGGDNDARHVNGWVKKFGATNFIFPVGNATYERQVELTNITAGSEFNVRYDLTTPNRSATQIPIRDVNRWEYWTVNRVSGGNAQVHLNWNNAKVYFPNYILADIAAVQWNGTVWTDQGGTATGNVATTGDITSVAQSSFTLFAIGSKSWVLPVTLISFTANRQDDQTMIAWTTANEYNVHHYTVERSDDGSTFYAIGLAAARNSHITEQYTETDKAAIHRIAYYRLRSADADGKEQLSQIVSVSESNNSNLVLVTNPVHDKITLLASGLNGEFRYHLIAMNGQLMQQGTLNVQNAGQYQIPLNGKLRQGAYSLRVVNQKQNFTYKVIVL
jgi:hypothetical protein